MLRCFHFGCLRELPENNCTRFGHSNLRFRNKIRTYFHDDFVAFERQGEMKSESIIQFKQLQLHNFDEMHSKSQNLKKKKLSFWSLSNFFLYISLNNTDFPYNISLNLWFIFSSFFCLFFGFIYENYNE